MHLKLSSIARVAVTRVDEVLDLGDHAGGLTHSSKARMMVSETNFMSVSIMLLSVRSYLPIVHLPLAELAPAPRRACSENLRILPLPRSTLVDCGYLVERPANDEDVQARAVGKPQLVREARQDDEASADDICTTLG